MTNEEFRDFYGKYFKFSTKVAYRVINDRDLAEDIGQEVFYKLYIMGDKLDFENEERILRLVKTATIHKAIDYQRSKTAKQETVPVTEEMTETLPDQRSGVEAQLLRMEESQYQKMILEKLRVVNKVNYDILIKVKYLDIPPDDVAREYGITRNNVNNRIRRTKQWIADEMSRVYKE